MLEKISLRNIVEFTRRSEKSRATYINSLKKGKKDSLSESGGDYWIISSSTIGNFFRKGDKELISQKIEEIIERKDKAKIKISKDMYDRNIAILNKFESFDFSKLKPNHELTYLPRPKDRSILTIKGVRVQVSPNYVFSFNQKGVDKIGAIWFIVKLNGFAVKETALFTDALFRYLNANYKNIEIDPDYCVALDLISQQHVKYGQIENNKINSELDSILGKIRKLL